jgi:type I restriction enzyme R subunit
MEAKAAGRTRGITYVAFTATPKDKTLELFGTRPDPSAPAADGNCPQPFHVYSMRQAIEEGFILDVLQNYTSYKLAFKLANNGKEYDETEVEKQRGHEGHHAVGAPAPLQHRQKVQVVVEHFRENVQPAARRQGQGDGGGQQPQGGGALAEGDHASTSPSRLPLGVLVAFSGEVTTRRATRSRSPRPASC